MSIPTNKDNENCDRQRKRSRLKNKLIETKNYCVCVYTFNINEYRFHIYI